MGKILILLGVVLLYFRRRKKFNRRNAAGVEEFKSFEHSVGNKFIETAMKFGGFALIIMGIAQIILPVITSKNKIQQTEIRNTTDTLIQQNQLKKKSKK